MNFIGNIWRTCAIMRNNKIFRLTINEKTYFLPLEVVTTISSVVLMAVNNDPLIQSMGFNINFKNKNNQESIMRFIMNRKRAFTEKELKDYDFIYDLATFSHVIGVPDLLGPVKEFIHNTNENYQTFPLERIFERIRIKQILQEDDTEEITFLSNSFDNIYCNPIFIQWGKCNIESIEKIFMEHSHNFWCQDSLIYFLLNILKQTNDYEFHKLFVYINKDFCSYKAYQFAINYFHNQIIPNSGFSINTINILKFMINDINNSNLNDEELKIGKGLQILPQTEKGEIIYKHVNNQIFTLKAYKIKAFRNKCVKWDVEGYVPVFNKWIPIHSVQSQYFNESEFLFYRLKNCNFPVISHIKFIHKSTTSAIEDDIDLQSLSIYGHIEEEKYSFWWEKIPTFLIKFKSWCIKTYLSKFHRK